MRRAEILGAALASLLVTCGSPQALQSPQPDAVARGESVYRTNGCPSCHEPNSSGHRTGPALDHIGSLAGTRRPGMGADEYIRQSILDPEAYFVAGYEGFASRSFDGPLSRESVDLMVAYLLSLK